MKKIYTEIGIGNDSFFSTEIEDKNREIRIKRFFLPKLVTGIYIRIWVLKKELIISSNKGFILRNRNKNKIKVLFGVSGVE
ncbi:DUF3977 family protein [Candidatus Woesearchaeota archaeon]|nr:DUF3977 family protein [Candidatus Woesearchaeota archaeon]